MDEKRVQLCSDRVRANGGSFRAVKPVRTIPAEETDTEIRLSVGWIAEMAGGDESALEMFYDNFVSRVYGLAIRIVRDPMVAEEVVSDTFLQVWRSSARYSPDRGKPIAWLLTIARSRAIDALRRRERAEPMENPLQQLEQGNQSSQSWQSNDALFQSNTFGDPAEILAGLNRDEALQQALTTLTKSQRQVMLMAYFQGYTHDEIAQRTAMPLGTVKSHIRRAQHRLKAILEAKSTVQGELH